MNRRSHRNLNLSAWPAFDVNALSQSRRKMFAARRQAVELYEANVAGAQTSCIRKPGVASLTPRPSWQALPP